MATIAYVLTGSEDRDEADQKSIVQDYSRDKNLRIDNYITIDVPSGRAGRYQRIQELFSGINRWDVVVVSDIAKIGQSVSEIVTLLRGLSERGIRFIAALQDLDLNGPGNASSKAVTSVFTMLAELENKYASERIRKALALRKKEGAVLGRPKGRISASKLDDRRELIIDYLSKGVSMTSLARILDTSPSNLLSYIRTRQITSTRRTRTAREKVPKKVSPEGISEKASPERVPEKASPERIVKDNWIMHDRVPRTLEENSVLATNRGDTANDFMLCRRCGKNIFDPRTTTCVGGYIDYADSDSFRRIPYPDTEKEKCSKCGTSPGGFHHDGCYVERCPRCGERLVSCACKKL